MQIIEINYSQNGGFYPVNIVPDNQYLMMLDNKVLYPSGITDVKRPLGRLNGLFDYEVYPSTFFSWQARVLTLPTNVQFDVIDNGIDDAKLCS